MSRTLGFATAVFLLVSCAGAPERQTATFEKPLTFSILEDYDKGEDLAGVEADFRLFRELGIDVWRGSFGWDDYEPESGRYDFAWLHRFAELAEHHAIDLRPYLAYTPAWAARPGGTDDAAWNDPPADLDRWYRFVHRLAEAMRPHKNVLSYEIYNEENSPMWWDGTVEEYAQVLRSGSDAVRAAGGDDQVLLGGLAYPDLEWVAESCADGAGAAFDMLPFHVYAETWPADEAVEELLEPQYFRSTFLPEADAACGTKPIWINETGFATTPGLRTEHDQANWWARAIATFAAEPRIEHIGVYEIKDRPRSADVIGEPENYHLGLTYPDRRKKLAFHTVARLVDLLDTGMITVADGALAVRVVAGRAGDLYHHLFIRPDGRQVLLLWDKTGSPTVEVTLPRAGAKATEYALDGTGHPHPGFAGDRLRVPLTPGDARVFAVAPE